MLEAMCLLAEGYGWSQGLSSLFSMLFTNLIFLGLRPDPQEHHPMLQTSVKGGTVVCEHGPPLMTSLF